MLTKINKDLAPIKGHYFLFNAGTGPVQPFLSTYARQLGFSASIVGLIYTILPICGMIAKPMTGAIADRFKCQKIIFLTAIVLTGAAFLVINFLPGLPIERRVHFSCDSNDAGFDTSVVGSFDNNSCSLTAMENDTSLTTCKLNCDMDDDFWTTVTNHWNHSKPENAQNFEFSTDVNKSLIFSAIDILYFPVKSIQIDGGAKIHPRCPSHVSTLCSVSCEDYKINDLIEPLSISNQDVYHKSEFWIFLLVMILGWVGQAIVVSIADAICFQLLGDKPNRYGVQRMFGSLGWGVFSVIAGLMVDSLSPNSSTKNFESAFYLSVAFLALDCVVSSRVKCVQEKHSTNILKDVSLLLVNGRILIFLVWCIGVGMCTGLIWNFLFFLIEDLAKAQGCDSQQWIKTLEGVIQAVQTLAGEMPFFFCSGKILKRIGHIHSMTLILIVIGVRYILYSVVTNPWYFLPIELLNGLTFGLFYACMASYASIVAPPGTESTMQGLVGAVFEGVGVSLGSFIGGLCYDAYNGSWTFRLFGIGALILALTHFAVQLVLSKLQKDTAGYEARYTSPDDALNRLYDDRQDITLVM